jgi:hypothetical protein
MSLRPDNVRQKPFTHTQGHASVTADKTTDMFLVPAGRTLVIDSVQYVNQTGLAADDTNFYIIKLLNGAIVAGSWSTKTTGGNGALVADTLVTAALSATPTDLVVPGGTKLKLFLDLTGTATLPAGSIRVDGHYVQ